MATKPDERTLRMIEEYVHWHFDAGEGPIEIAKRFNLSVTTVYRYLGKISEISGYTREQLLEEPEHSGERTCYNGHLKTAEPIDTSAFLESCKKFDNDLGEAIDSLDKWLQKETRELGEN